MDCDSYVFKDKFLRLNAFVWFARRWMFRVFGNFGLDQTAFEHKILFKNLCFWCYIPSKSYPNILEVLMACFNI